MAGRRRIDKLVSGFKDLKADGSTDLWLLDLFRHFSEARREPRQQARAERFLRTRLGICLAS